MTIDPGRPFSKTYQALIDAMEERLRYGVEQPDTARFVYRKGMSSYDLPRPAYAINQVTGIANNQFTIFLPGEDYIFSDNRIRWEKNTPTEGTRFEVDYTYRDRPAGLSDFNPGSVIGTLVRAVTREMKLMYEQMDEAYRRAFIDQATGVALDNVVALLGIVRNPPIHATGTLKFFRGSPTNKEIMIEEGTQVADESGRTFVTTARAILAVQIDEYLPVQGSTIRVAQEIGEITGLWVLRPGEIAYAELPAPPEEYGTDQRTVTLPPNIPPGAQVRVAYKPLSVVVPIRAQEPGVKGNVNAGSIIVMPTPPSGIEGISNELPTAGGAEAENDTQLRDRAKHALERSGNATLNAIKYAILEIDGIEAVEVLDYTVDDSIPLGEVHVRYSGGSDTSGIEDQVKGVVEETRAAGIRARVEKIRETLVYGTVYVYMQDQQPPNMINDARAILKTRLVEAINTLTLGESLALKRVLAQVYDIPGLAGVAEAQLLKATDPAGKTTFDETILIKATELLRPDDTRIMITVLNALKIVNTKGSKGNFTISVQLTDANNAAITFGRLEIDLTVTLRGTPLSRSEQVRINRFTRRVAFNASNTAELTLTADDMGGTENVKNFAEVEAALTAAEFPAIEEARTVLQMGK